MIIVCKRCKSKFFFTESEQSFYKSRGLNIPKYCPSCRKKKQPATAPSTPHACSTCYFCGPKQQCFTKPSITQPGYLDYKMLHVCTRSNKPIVNDAPCKFWTKKGK